MAVRKLGNLVVTFLPVLEVNKMPVEEHKELRDLVTQTLQAKGVLQKVQAEIRASVFLALEEQEIFKDKSLFINQPLKDYVSSQEGLIAISLVREFLDFFNLEFSTVVFDPETHAGLDYNYEGRSKLSRDLMLESNSDSKVPLLGLLVKLISSSIKKSSELVTNKNSSVKSDVSKGSDSTSESSEKVYSNGINGDSDHKSQASEAVPSERLESEKTEEKSEGKRVSFKRDNMSSASLASLGNLPPLNKASPNNTFSKGGIRQQNIKDLKAILDLEPGSNNEEDILSSISDKGKKNEKPEAASEESEVEDEVSEVASALTDDNTIDISISKESGKGDYFEDL